MKNRIHINWTLVFGVVTLILSVVFLGIAIAGAF